MVFYKNQSDNFLTFTTFSLYLGKEDLIPIYENPFIKILYIITDLL